MSKTAIGVVVALPLALVLTPLAMVVATRTGFLDRPAPLKSQSSPVPYLGGVAVMLASAVGILLGRPWLALPLFAALVLGVLDDRSDLPIWTRFAGQVGVGLGIAAVVPGGWQLPAVPVVAIVCVVLINGVNLLDGLDALAGGVVGIALIGFAVVLNGGARVVASTLAAALVAFLVYNRPPARIYLGDGGSYLLGATMCALIVWAWAPDTRLPVSTAGLLLVAVPTGEILFAMIRRLRAGRSPFSGDRRHPYDLLVSRGWSVGSVALCYIGAQAALTILSVCTSASDSAIVPTVAAVVSAAVLSVAAYASGALRPDSEATGRGSVTS